MAALPATNLIPSLLTNAKVYRDGKDLLGIADLEMPDFEYMSDSITGLGIMGELEIPAIGHFKSMSVKLKWNVPKRDAYTLILTEGQHLDVRGNIQKADGGTGQIINEAVKVVMHGLPKKTGIGKFEPAKKMETETELEVYLLKMWIGGQEVLEIDKFNFVFAVHGVNQMAEIRRNMGMQ